MIQDSQARNRLHRNNDGNTTRSRVYALVLVLQSAITTSVCGQIEIGASPNPVGSGARAMAQGNAFIAVADDATAASWNPGGLPQLQKPEFSFALEHFSRREHTESTSHLEVADTDTVRSGNFEFFGRRFGDSNYASLVQPFFYGKNMVFSLNFLKLYRFDKSMTFPFNSSDRDAVFDFEQYGEFSVLAPAYGIEVSDTLSLGISVNIWNHSVTGSSRYQQTSKLDGVLTRPSGAKSEFTHRIINRFEVNTGYSVVFGALYRPTRAWTFGAVVKPTYRLRLDSRNHDINYQADTNTGFVERDDNDIKDENVKLRFPLILGTGAAWRPNDQATVSVDLTWTQWSEYQLEKRGTTTNPLTNVDASVDELDDTLTLRLGGEWLILLENHIVPVRCGIGYDPAPAVGDRDDFYTVSLGTGVQSGRVMFDIAWEYRWGNNVNRDILRGVDGRQDIRGYRVLSSLIYYF